MSFFRSMYCGAISAKSGLCYSSGMLLPYGIGNGTVYLSAVFLVVP